MDPGKTYWYLEAAPELMARAGERWNGTSEPGDERARYLPEFNRSTQQLLFSSSERFFYQVSQMVSYRRAETTPKGSYSPGSLRVDSAPRHPQRVRL